MPAVFFKAQFGDLPLLISEISTERGRDVVIQSPSQGDKHTLSDRGRRAGPARCEILFVDQPGLAPYTDRYEAFVKLAEKPQAQVFTHPLDGSYLARAAELTPSASAGEGAVKIACTFIPDSEPQQVFDVVDGGPTIAGVESVGVAAAAANDSLTAIGETSTVPAACVAAITEWSEAGEDLDSQQVFLEVQSLVQQLDEAVDELELARDLSRWDAYRQMALLRYQLVLAADLVTAAAEVLFDVYVEVARPMRAICAELYGAFEADDRADEATHRNGIRTPGRVPAGTTLKMARST